MFTFFLGILGLIFLWVLPLLWEQLTRLTQEFPKILGNSQVLLQGLYARYPDVISSSRIEQFYGHMSNLLAGFGKSLLGFSFASIISIVTVSVYLVLGPLLVFFFLRDNKKIVGWLKGFLPQERTILQKIWLNIQLKISCYIHGKLIEMLIVSVFTIAAFWVLGLRYSFLLGVLVGVSVIIPYIGVVLVTIPVAIVGLIDWGVSTHFWYLMLVYLLINLLDANVLVPVLYAEVMDLHPVAIMLAVLIFGCLGGFWGVFFAIPLMTIVNVLIKLWPVKK